MAEVIFAAKNTFKSFVQDLVDAHIYDKQSYVLPYEPTAINAFTVVDFFPNIALGTVINVFINDTLSGQASIVDVSGLVYFTLSLPLGIFTLQFKTVGGDLLREQFFRTLNLYLYLHIFALLWKDLRVEASKQLTDLGYLTVRDGAIYPNFGFLYDFPRPFFFDFATYRSVLLGSTPLTGLKAAFGHQSTIQGIIDVIEAFGGTLKNNPPTNLSENITWRIFASRKYTFPTPGNPARTDTDPGVDHYFIFDPSDVTQPYAPQPNIVLSSGVQNANTVNLQIKGVEIAVVNEPIVKHAVDPDQSANRFLDSLITTTITDSLGNTYVQGVDYDVKFTTGAIYWNTIGLSGFKPATNSVYFFSYTFFPIDLISSVLTRIKPSHVRLTAQFFDKNDVEYIIGFAAFDVDVFDAATSKFA